MIDARLSIARLSSIYETEPVEVENDQPSYLNMVAELSLDAGALTAEQLLARLQRIESSLGRRREGFHSARKIDLDLLLYAEAQCDTEFLKLPHPRLAARRFVLAPLAELAPGLRHPTLDKTISELLADADDRAIVRPWRP
jgi:2-amino-4-hydroxy-6-hydroxymethyldihydropteridine diphosphokinase